MSTRDVVCSSAILKRLAVVTLTAGSRSRRFRLPWCRLWTTRLSRSLISVYSARLSSSEVKRNPSPGRMVHPTNHRWLPPGDSVRKDGPVAQHGHAPGGMRQSFRGGLPAVLSVTMSTTRADLLPGGSVPNSPGLRRGRAVNIGHPRHLRSVRNAPTSAVRSAKSPSMLG